MFFSSEKNIFPFPNGRGADLSMTTTRPAGHWRILALVICVGAGAWVLDLLVL